MKKVTLLSLLACATVISGCATTSSDNQQKWVCTAPNMVSGTYQGGEYANIHISPYGGGGRYPVVKDGNTAIGTTKNGTEFVCKLK